MAFFFGKRLALFLSKYLGVRSYSVFQLFIQLLNWAPVLNGKYVYLKQPLKSNISKNYSQFSLDSFFKKVVFKQFWTTLFFLQYILRKI